MRPILKWMTIALLVGAFMASLWALYRDPTAASFTTAVALLAAITGLLIDPWLERRERRRECLNALLHELYMDRRVLDEPIEDANTPAKPVELYSRLYTAALETAVGSGAFGETRDRELFRLLRGWHQRASEYNQRLQFTEVYLATHPSPESVTAFRSRIAGGAVRNAASTAVDGLVKHLLEHYSAESGINRDTVLFGAPS